MRRIGGGMGGDASCSLVVARRRSPAHHGLMCGRYALYGPAGLPPRTLRIPEDEWRLAPRYNVAPSQFVPVIREHPPGERHVIEARWGLVPGWAESPEALKHHPVNARCEGVESKPMFKWAFRNSRVLIPASGFYEWQTVAGTKQPWFHPAPRWRTDSRRICTACGRISGWTWHELSHAVRQVLQCVVDGLRHLLDSLRRQG